MAMVETDWREILSFTQKDLKRADKEKLCESLSWMEADDIELNFSDLKTFFKLAQDLLKYKTEQVNNLLGALETSKTVKTKKRSTSGSPAESNESVLDTILHQEEEIKANKEILAQLHADIARLESEKQNIGENLEKDSESSRDIISEINELTQLEHENVMKNKHIRKLLSDVKKLEEDNTVLKEKTLELKDKLKEATLLIENLSEQLFAVNKECVQLKDLLGKYEEAKVHITIEKKSLKKELSEQESIRQKFSEEIKNKVSHWKNIARSRKAELDEVYGENERLKALLKTKKPSNITDNKTEELKVKELQEKLTEASNKIIESANLIGNLRSENRQLKLALKSLEETQDTSLSEAKNESDDGKQRSMLNKLHKKIKTLTTALKASEEMISCREKELTEISSQMQLLRSDDSINALFKGLKNNKRQLKFKDDQIKSLVKEVNDLNQIVNNLQLENETMRQKLNLPPEKKIPTKGILKEYNETQKKNLEITAEMNKIENELVSIKMDNRKMNYTISKLTKTLNDLGYNDNKIHSMCKDNESDDEGMASGEGESSVATSKRSYQSQNLIQTPQETDADKQTLIEENEGLRKGLLEILDFLKGNNAVTSGTLSLQCPSLEAVLRSMEARHAAGWFAPHMATLLELKAAVGGRDALRTELHNARKETFEVMNQLSKESKRSSELEYKIKELECLKNQTEVKGNINDERSAKFYEISTWISNQNLNDINIFEKTQIEQVISESNHFYEDQIKNTLEYFYDKFKTLFNKMTSLIVLTTDTQNKWFIQEENYKAQIENLTIQLRQGNDEDKSEDSDGLVIIPSVKNLQRKCSYLQEAYKNIRTLNENVRNDFHEYKRNSMTTELAYEKQNQKLIINIFSLLDKLRCSISQDLFWKQNEALNELVIKYRKTITDEANQEESTRFIKRLEDHKNEILKTFQNELAHGLNENNDNVQVKLFKMEQSLQQNQLHELCRELEDKNKIILNLETKNIELQDTVAKLIDNNLCASTKDEIELLKEKNRDLTENNEMLKEQCKHFEHQLEVSLSQLQETQHRKIINDMEINMLRHQVVDLQSTGDSEAIIARLSNEILVGQLQASENHEKIKNLHFALNKEKQLRVEAEEFLWSREKVFEVHMSSHDTKLRYIYEVMQMLRQQYQGSLPIASLENYLNNLKEYQRKTQKVEEKLDEVEEFKFNLMSKHSAYDQILNNINSKCFELEDICSHKLKSVVMESIHAREMDHLSKKIDTLEISRQDLVRKCNSFERNLILLNQGFRRSYIDELVSKSSENNDKHNSDSNLQMEDLYSDNDVSSRKSQTITLSDPRVLKISQDNANLAKNIEAKLKNQSVQTNATNSKLNKLIQTEIDPEANELRFYIQNLKTEIEDKKTQLTAAMDIAQQRTEEILMLKTQKNTLESIIENLRDSSNEQIKINESLRTTITNLKEQLNDFERINIEENKKVKEQYTNQNSFLLQSVKQFENDKNEIISEYKELMKTEREKYSKSIKELQMTVAQLQSQMDRRDSEPYTSNGAAVKEVVNKYTQKNIELEEKCFKLQSELDGCNTELITYQSEVDRWKELASERLSKMERQSSQLEERHCQEVNSYKAENQHWLSQLNENQKEHMELRSHLMEQKAGYVKQLAEKDALIEQLRSVVNNLKTQVVNMQTMISINDPTFDLSAIVEVDEASDAISPQETDRLELKFDSGDTNESQEDIRIPASSTAIWQETLIERLRREKQFAGKQNTILRRQVKILGARERRARLDAQNLKNQVFRITTSGTRVSTVETAALQSKIASLQAQLTNARRDTHSSVALWDKWKRAQQASDRWQTRYEEKCLEAKKLEATLNLTKSAVTRLEREKRVLLARLTEAKHDKQIAVEKQENEDSEKFFKTNDRVSSRVFDEVPAEVSNQALLERVEAQQRRITALQIAEKGNEILVSEYEKSLAEITALKGQILKLESTLLESQIRSPIKDRQETQPELEYWKSYCSMLKDENVQLIQKVSALEYAPVTTTQHRVSDLEQTVLTLRGIVSKLQAEQKSNVAKRPDSRPSSGRSTFDKSRNQFESWRVEVANLKKSILDKDLLLERSKEMLKIAAEREDELLRENAMLRRRVREASSFKEGFLSA